jgi:hypothetical protein
MRGMNVLDVNGRAQKGDRVHDPEEGTGSAPLRSEQDAEEAAAPGPRFQNNRPSRTIRFDDVTAKAVPWLWPARLPAGMLAVLDGPPGTGKSTVIIDIIARMTTGSPWPNEAGAGGREPASVVLLGHEDSPEYTIRPRLDAAGADPGRVYMIDEIAGRFPRLPDDSRAIEAIVRKNGASLIVIDPVSAYIGSVDFHRDNEVRSALAPLSGIAERTGASVLLLRHLRKSGGTDAIGRGLGSMAIIALARVGLMLLPDPDDPKARVLAWSKMNVGLLPPSLRLRSVDTNGQPRISWEGVCDLTADAILARQDRALKNPDGKDGARAIDNAETWLAAQLAERGWAPSVPLIEAAERAGISEPTLRRAQRRLGVRPRRENGPGGRGMGRWVWVAPEHGGAGNAFKITEKDSLITLDAPEASGGPNSAGDADLGDGFKVTNVQDDQPPLVTLNASPEGTA